MYIIYGASLDLASQYGIKHFFYRWTVYADDTPVICASFQGLLVVSLLYILNVRSSAPAAGEFLKSSRKVREIVHRSVAIIYIEEKPLQYIYTVTVRRLP